MKAKNNLAAHDQKSLTFTFETKNVGTDRRNDKTILAPYIVWGKEHVDVTASDAMAAASGTRAPAAMDEAKSFLKEALAKGPRPQKELLDEASGAGITEKTLRRAKTALGITSRKNGLDGGWMWRGPEDGQTRA